MLEQEIITDQQQKLKGLGGKQRAGFSSESLWKSEMVLNWAKGRLLKI